MHSCMYFIQYFTPAICNMHKNRYYGDDYLQPKHTIMNTASMLDQVLQRGICDGPLATFHEPLMLGCSEWPVSEW